MTLGERIRSEIRASGPMPFDRFMALALYEPDGFFGGAELRSTAGGDFLTSPEVSPAFGEALAAFALAERSRIGDPFEVVEVGAGSGSLLRSLLGVAGLRATAVEASPAAREALARGLPGVKVTSRLEHPIRGVVIANELVDNLPMALAQRVDSGWRERWVGSGGAGLELVDAPPRPEVVAWLGEYAGDVPDGGWVEVQLEAARWLAGVLDLLVDGSVVVVDYGDTADNLLHRRRDGTLRTYRGHHLGPDPLVEPGETDITADVNFSALTSVAAAAGAEVSLHRQDEFLADLGLRDRLSELRQAELAAARAGDEPERLRLRHRRTGVETLLHPRGLGDFRVLVARMRRNRHEPTGVQST
jgi:SAM-dependent MidA family methyltransferase